MASIRKRKTSKGTMYTVLYDFEDTNGERRQKSAGTFNNKKDAETVQREIDFKKSRNNFIVPSNETVEAFMKRWLPVRARLKKWEFSYYKQALGTFEHHILPEIGQIPIQKVIPEHIESMFANLQEKRCSGPKSFNREESEIPYLSGSTLQSIYNHLKSLFDAAVSWKDIESSPVLVAKPPRDDPPEQAIWDLSMTMTALANISDPVLHLMVHIASAHTCRNGEVCGLTWDSVDFDRGMVLIDKTLQRIDKEAYDNLPKKDVIKVFPNKAANSTSMLVLKTPKTRGSVRWIYRTKPLIKELRHRQQQLEKDKAYLGGEFNDYNLVFCLENGDPVEPKLCETRFKKWQKRNTELDLPLIVFHRLRHSATTLLMYLSGSDAKTVQSITGHASAEFVFDTYNHSLMSRQRSLIDKLERVMYNITPDNSEEKTSTVTVDSEKTLALLDAIRSDPQFAREVFSALYATVAVEAEILAR